MRLFVVGCSYRTAPLALRERLAFPAAELPSTLRQVSLLPAVGECLLVSTCNRVEVYGAAGKPAHAIAAVAALLSSTRNVPMDQLEPALYKLEDEAAVKHIFSVVSSLDAMVVGEAQIAGQVKEAHSAAARSRTVGPLLSRCMHRAFATAKRVRHETDIARHPVSVSSVAADLAGRIFGELAARTVLVIGAGEMAELAVRHLVADGATDVRVVNRTYERAVQLAFGLGARAQKWDQLEGQLLLADIVISSTGSEQPILTRKLLGDIMRGRKQRPLFVVDIAVPRDVEKAAGKLGNVYLYDVDDLEGVVAENLKERRKEVRQAERIVEEELAHFATWLRTQDAVPVIKQLREQFTDVVRAEAERTAQLLHLDEAQQRQVLEAMAAAIVNKLLHQPTQELKRQAQDPSGARLARSVRELFHLAETMPAVEPAELDGPGPDGDGEVSVPTVVDPLAAPVQQQNGEVRGGEGVTLQAADQELMKR
jgi:glutamyl-tRNA reductase